jgi:outer membrane protein assembly factor BamE
MKMRQLLISFIAASTLLLAGCSLLEPYKLEIQQGNALPEDAVDRLQAGMTPEQVRFLLGEPLVTDPFRRDRWDYVFYRVRDKRADLEYRRITIHFVDGQVVRIEDAPAPVVGPASPGAPEEPSSEG